MLTPEQKNTVAEFMGWVSICNGHSKIECSVFNSYCTECVRYKTFSLNDASLCVKKLVKMEKWDDFHCHAYIRICYRWGFTVWLMTVESGEAYNFFAAMAAWIEEEKRK